MKKLDLRTGAWLGLLLTAPLLAILYFAHQLVGLPFVPFDAFDRLVRLEALGRPVTIGVDALVRLLTFLSLSLRETSKTAEQIIALLGTLLVGVLAGIVYVAVLRWRKLERAGRWTGPILGLALGIPAALSLGVGQPPTGSPLFGAMWVLAAFSVWGGALGWAYDRLARIAPEAATGTPSESLSITQASRREFLVKLGGATAAITVVGAGLGAALGTSTRRRTAAAPGSSAISGEVLHPTPIAVELPSRPDAIEPAPGTRSEYPPVSEHFRLDISLIPPAIDGASWTLPITGLVDRPLPLTLADFYNKRFGEPLHQFVTLACISNPIGGDLIGTTLWTGVSLRRVLEAVGVQDRARFLRVVSQDGFHETVSLNLIEADERIMLAYLWDGRPLTIEHGYPLRIYIPDLYGMKQPKWVTGLELIENEVPGYWVQRGWDEVARVRMASVIDTVAVDDAYEKEGQMWIPIGGIAYAGARGISKVEVKIDEGEWIEAELREPLSDLTWSLWRYDWPFGAGAHTFYVRAYDGGDVPQIERRDPPHPGGATGIHKVTKTL